MESTSLPNSPSALTLNRKMAWRLSSSTGSITTSSGGSTGSKSQVRSTGRGGSGNIRRHSISGDGESHTSTRVSSSKSTAEEMKDDVVAPKGLELNVSSNIGIKSSGRGGSGNINGSRKLLRVFGDQKPPDHEELEAREREVLAAHRAQKQAKASTKRTTYGRGGLGNLRGGKKSKKSGDIGLVPIKPHGRRRSSSLVSRSSSSSIKRRNQKGKSIATTESSQSIRRSSLDSFSYLNDPPQLFLEIPPSPSTSSPIASTSRLPPPPQRPIPKVPIPNTPDLDNPPSPLLSFHQSIQNPSLNVGRKLPRRPSSPDGSQRSQVTVASSQVTVASSQRSRAYIQRQSAGGGAEWRLVTQVREERRGTRKYIIEEPVWELFTREDIRREKQEAYEMKMMNKWVEKGKKKGWVSDIADGYVSEPV